VLQIYREEDPTRQMWKIGQALITGLNELAKQTGISAQFEAGGVACSPWFVCRDAAGNVSMPFRTLFLQEMVERGVLINYLAPSWSHKDEHVEQTLAGAGRGRAVPAERGHQARVP
jgi:glutamate-1-semialdehyde 2,1-aminomutase